MRRLYTALVFALIPASVVALDPMGAKPPVAEKVAHIVELHGDRRVDDYFWMKDKANPAVIKHLEAENAYTSLVMKPTEPFQAALYKEFLGRIKQTDQNVPHKDNGYWYYTRTEEGKQYTIYCRKKGTLDAPEEVMLDANEMAKGEKFFHLGGVNVSDDNNLVAFLTDTTGFRENFLSVKDLRTGKLLESKFVKASHAEWAADNKTLFYVTEDAAKRDHKLWRHSVGDAKEKDALVAEEKDELFRLEVSRSHDRKYLFRTYDSETTNEEWFLPANDPTGEWKIIAPRQDGHEYSADHRDGLFYIRTNKDKAINFKLMTCPVADTRLASWKEFIPHNPAVHLTGFSLFKDFLVVSEMENALPQLRVLPFGQQKPYQIDFPEPVYSAHLGANPEFDTQAVHLTYTSLVTPDSVYEFDLATKQRKLLKRQDVLGGYNSDDYASERVYATSADGVKVPISLVYKKGTPKDGTAPMLLTGYGAYGYSVSVEFSSNNLSLLDRGVIFAEAHIRGGSDMGRQWYEDGKMLKKKNSFTDFIACADYLVKEKYCARDKLVIEGASAGGLLIGATINMRPDLCKAALLRVPFVDVINSMLDETVPLTVPEFLEWGNPKKKEEYDYMKTYCPYSNIEKKRYPALLVTTSLNDSQVLFHEPTKYVARMRELNPKGNLVLFKCIMAGGHGGVSGRYDSLKDLAFRTAFILDQMGITK